MPNYIASHYDRQEIEQKIIEIKSTLEKSVSSFEKYILNDMLKKCENALLELERDDRNG